MGEHLKSCLALPEGVITAGGLVRHRSSKGLPLIRVIEGFLKTGQNNWHICFKPVDSGGSRTKIQVNTLLRYKEYSYRAPGTHQGWRCFKTNTADTGAAGQKVSSNPCLEVELPNCNALPDAFFREHPTKYEATGETNMNPGNLENPINNVRYTEVNGTKITEMSDRQLIGAINNFNNEITQLDEVPVESKAINKHIKRLEKAMKRCVKELDAR